MAYSYYEEILCVPVVDNNSLNSNSFQLIYYVFSFRRYTKVKKEANIV